MLRCPCFDVVLRSQAVQLLQRMIQLARNFSKPQFCKIVATISQNTEALAKLLIKNRIMYFFAPSPNAQGCFAVFAFSEGAEKYFWTSCRGQVSL